MEVPPRNGVLLNFIVTNRKGLVGDVGSALAATLVSGPDDPGWSLPT